MSSTGFLSEQEKKLIAENPHLFFSSTAPNNAITFGSTPSCENCGSADEHKLHACGDCPESDRSWYCSRQCQVSDWKVHKNYCRSKQLYAATLQVGLSSWNLAGVPNVKKDDEVKAVQKQCKIMAPSSFWSYLRLVPPRKRPRTMLDHSRKSMSRQHSAEVLRAINHLVNNTTYKQHVKLTEELSKTKYKDKFLGEVPIHERRCYMDWPNGERQAGINLWPQDDKISIGFWDQRWGCGKSEFLDPWKVHISKMGEAEALASLGQVDQENELPPLV